MRTKTSLLRHRRSTNNLWCIPNADSYFLLQLLAIGGDSLHKEVTLLEKLVRFIVSDSKHQGEIKVSYD